MGANNVTRPNDFFPRFFRKYWVILDVSVVGFIQCAFQKGTFLEDLNATPISLIPKKDAPEYVSQFRPIALCNVVMKVLTKVIVD